MKEFRIKIDLGKVDGYHNGRNTCAAEVDVAWQLLPKVKEGKITYNWEFSASGAIWNNRKTDWISGGQNLDYMNRFAPIRNNPTFREVYALWKMYHLNCMTAGSPAQESARHDFTVDREGVTWAWYDKNDITENTDSYGRHITDNEAEAAAANAAGHYVRMAQGDYNDQLAVYLAKRGLYTDTSFIYDGKPYKYGHAWLVTEIPEADKERIRAIMGITRSDEERAEAESDDERAA